MLNIAVLVSGGGTNLGALIEAQTLGEIPNGKITLVVSSNESAYALTRAKNAGIATTVISKKTESTAEAREARLVEVLKDNKIDLVVLAGYMWILGKAVISEFPNKIINVHPALIPSFCGPGFYGLRVHEAALKKGVKVTGATVHFVTEECDGGPIILQKAVEVKEGDTPEVLQKRVMEQAEWRLLPKAVSLFCDGKLKIQDNIVHIL